jgi:hypothetical protein
MSASPSSDLDNEDNNEDSKAKVQDFGRSGFRWVGTWGARQCWLSTVGLRLNQSEVSYGDMGQLIFPISFICRLFDFVASAVSALSYSVLRYIL